MIWVWTLVGVLLIGGALFFLLTRPASPKSAQRRPEAAMLLREERLRVRKTREQLADVTTRKEVTRQLKTVTVPVTREELVVEKDGEEAARIPLCEEQVQVSTQVVPLNEVSVHQREWEEHRTVEAVLKKEVARVETTGDADRHIRES